MGRLLSRRADGLPIWKIESDYIYIVAGLIGLFSVARHWCAAASGLPRCVTNAPLLSGLTVVGFGTSTPELLVSVQAALSGVPDIAVGNTSRLATSCDRTSPTSC
ncbi:hypothetical protein J4E08_14300 [Sagittula sp. NFXS13]